MQQEKFTSSKNTNTHTLLPENELKNLQKTEHARD